MAAAQILYACGEAQRAPNGLRLKASVSIRIPLIPFRLADVYGTAADDWKRRTITAFVFFSHILRRCGSGIPARPNYRLVVEPIVTEAVFEHAKQTGTADVGDGSGQFRPLGYSMTYLFTPEGYDAFSNEIEAEFVRRSARTKSRREPVAKGSHEEIRTADDLLLYLSYAVPVTSGSRFQCAYDEWERVESWDSDPVESPGGHLLDILDPRRPINIDGACNHQRPSYIHVDTANEDEDVPTYYWQAPWSTVPGGTNPLVYVFGDSLPWNLAGDANDFLKTALIGTPTPVTALKKITASRATQRQKRRIADWDEERDGRFEKIFKGEDPQIGPIQDPRKSIPLHAPPPSRRGVSRVVEGNAPMENYEQHGYVALGSIRRQTEQRLDAMTDATGVDAVLDYLLKTAELIETSTGTVSPPQLASRREFGDELKESLRDDKWARDFFSKCTTAESLSARIQLCLAKFFGLSAAQIAFGFGLVFCGQVLPLLTTAPRMHVFCVGKAMAGKSVVVDVITSLLFPSAVRRFDSSSAQAASCDTISGMTIQVIDESLKLTPGQLEQWKVMLSSGINRRQRPWLNEDTGQFQVKTSVNVSIESTLATGNCSWQLMQPDEEGMKALESRFKRAVMPNARGNFNGSTNPNRNRALLALRGLVHDASDMASVNLAGVVFSKGAVRIFYKYLEAKGQPFLDRRRQAMFEAVVHGQMQLELYVKSRGLSRMDRLKLYLREGFFSAGNIAAAYKIFAEMEQTHVREVVVKGLASLLDFDRSFDTISKACTGIDVKTSDCTFFLALPATVSVTRGAIPRLAASVSAAVPEELKHKLPDLDNITTKLLSMIDLGEIKVINVDQKARYGISPDLIGNEITPSDRAVLGVLADHAEKLSIPQLTADEKRHILKEDIVDDLVKNEPDGLSPTAAAKWKLAVDKYTLDQLQMSIARLRACGHLKRERSAFMATYVRTDEDTAPASEQTKSVLKPGWNVKQGSKVSNVVTFDRSVGSLPRGGAMAQTSGERIANEWLATCSPKHHNTEVDSLVRLFEQGVVPPKHFIRKPTSKQTVLVGNPDYEGDVPCDGPDDGQERCFIDPGIKQFNLASVQDIDRLAQEQHLRTNFPNATDLPGLLAALS